MNLIDQHSTVEVPRVQSLKQREVTPIEVIQYGDFECLYCGRAVITLKAFRTRFERNIRFSYRHFPVETYHPYATQAAEAAECAHAQGRFWRMHDLLMANQDQLELQCIYDYAEQIGLDMTRFDIEMDDEAYLPTVRAHIAEGIAKGVSRTPAFLVDGTLVECKAGLGTLYEATDVAIALASETLGR